MFNYFLFYGISWHLYFHSADVNAKDNFKWCPLHFACHAGQLDVVQFLLDRGADLDAQTANGGTPLMRAVESSRESVVSFLIGKGYVSLYIFSPLCSTFARKSLHVIQRRRKKGGLGAPVGQ